MQPQRLNKGMDFIPKVMGVVAVLPMFLGLSWLTWILVAESLTILREWTPVEARVLDDSSDSVLRLEIRRGGQTSQLDVPWTGDLETAARRGAFAAFQNPADPAAIRPDEGGALWAGPAITGFFAAFLGGVFVFLWRTAPMAMPVFALPGDPRRSPRRTLSTAVFTVRDSGRRWRSARRKAVVTAAAAAALLLAGQPAPLPLRGGAAVVALLWAGWTLRRGWSSRSFQLRSEPSHLTLSQGAETREIHFRQIAQLMHQPGTPGIYTLVDGRGAAIARFDGDLEPTSEFNSLLERIHDWLEEDR